MPGHSPTISRLAHAIAALWRSQSIRSVRWSRRGAR